MQLTLFDTPILNIQTGQPIISESVKIEDIDHPDFKKLYKGTEFIISLLPFGGFVQVGDDTNNIDESQIDVLKRATL